MDYFEKKQWARAICSLLAALVITLFLSGIIGGKEMTYQLPDANAPVAADENGK